MSPKKFTKRDLSVERDLLKVKRPGLNFFYYTMCYCCLNKDYHFFCVGIFFLKIGD